MGGMNLTLSGESNYRLKAVRLRFSGLQLVSGQLVVLQYYIDIGVYSYTRWSNDEVWGKRQLVWMMK